MRAALLLALLTACASEFESADSEFEFDDEFERPWVIPASAVMVAPNLYYLGETIDIDGKTIEGYAWVDSEAKPDNPGGGNGNSGGGGGDGGSSCYTDIGGGSQTAVEDWGVGTLGLSSLVEADVIAELDGAMGDWETEAGNDIFGSYDAASSGTVDLSTTDGENNVIFDDLGTGGTVAVTYSWGVFRGPPRNRGLVEWDQIYNDVYQWSNGDPVSATGFDFRSVGAHELGHAAGLGHPDSTCVDETMYAYVSVGEDKKRTLNAGDIAGINTLY